MIIIMHRYVGVIKTITTQKFIIDKNEVFFSGYRQAIEPYFFEKVLHYIGKFALSLK